MTDPRKNAPQRICDLPREEMMEHLYARDKQRRDEFMARYQSPPKPSLFARIKAVRASGRVG